MAFCHVFIKVLRSSSLIMGSNTLDLDSTVMTLYGAQEGEVRGYSPAKRGRASHHLLMAFVADTRMIANCWLRPGNSSSANNVQAFLANTLHRLGGKHVSLLRGDCGFSDSAFLDHLDQRQMHYVIALRQNLRISAHRDRCAAWCVARLNFNAVGHDASIFPSFFVKLNANARF